jgi:hypothetical protein
MVTWQRRWHEECVCSQSVRVDSFAGSNRGHLTLAGPVTEELHLCVHACAYACRLAGMVSLGF